jgi:hypothetical protein
MRGRHADAAAYRLGVLDDPEEFEEHLLGCARCRGLVTGFGPVAGALADAARLGWVPRGGPSGRYRPPGDGAAGKPYAHRRGSVAGPLLLLVLGMAVTAVGVARPVAGKIRVASAAYIVSPALVVDLRRQYAP